MFSHRCLSGNGDPSKFTWYEAKAMCEAKGWRLCRREELDAKNGARCCSRDPTYDICGYNTQLVWTSNLGGLQLSDNHGRLHSPVAFESVSHLTVDLGEVLTVRGLQIQGGVADELFYGPSCFIELLYYSIVFWTVGILLWHSARISPRHGVKIAFFGGMGIVMLVFIARILIFAADSSVPGFFSQNAICPLEDYEKDHFAKKNFENFFGVCLILLMFLIQLLRPERLFTYSVSGYFFMMFSRDAFLPPHKILDAMMYGALGVLCPLILRFLRSRSQAAALKATKQDSQKYEDVWEQAGGLGTSKEVLSVIRVECDQTFKAIAEERQRVVTSTQFSLLKRSLFLIRARGLGPYSRTGKQRQRTCNLNQIFEEVHMSTPH